MELFDKSINYNDATKSGLGTALSNLNQIVTEQGVRTELNFKMQPEVYYKLGATIVVATILATFAHYAIKKSFFNK